MATTVVMLVMLCVWGVGLACHNPFTATELAASGTTRSIAFHGLTSAGRLGDRVSAVGDVNGDGFDDVVFVAPLDANWVGAAYLVFGRSAEDWANTPAVTFNFTTFPDTPNASSWIKITGVLSSEHLGNNGLTYGDFNCDGFSDFGIGSSTSGLAYVVFGHDGDWASFSVNFIATGTIPGIQVNANLDCFIGNAGDMNGDGIEDFLITNYSVTTATPFVIFGRIGNTPGIFNLNDVNGLNGFQLTSIDSSSIFGIGTFGNVGDINGDGIADLVIGDSEAQKVFVVFAKNVSVSGSWAATFNLSTLDGNNGFTIIGSVANFGHSVVGAGDLNDDGFADFYIGISSQNDAACVVFGHATPWATLLNASILDGTNGFHFSSPLENANWGATGGTAGDVNGDGVDDLVIGGHNAFDFTNILQTGAAVVILGRKKGVAWPAAITRSEVVGSVGFQIDGISTGSKFGYSARGAGDLNGDGISDIVIGAPYYNSNAGTVLLMFGIDDRCSVCTDDTGSTASNVCLVCRDDGFAWNGSACALAPPLISSSLSVSSSSSRFMVVITTNCTIMDLIGQISARIGSFSVDSIVETQPGVFEFACFTAEDAQKLRNGIQQNPPGVCNLAVLVDQSSSSPTTMSSASRDIVIVIINFDEDVTGEENELELEIAEALGIDVGLVSVVVVTPTQVQVTIAGETVSAAEATASQLVNIINNGNGGGSGSTTQQLLRKAIDAHIRRNEIQSSNDNDVNAAPSLMRHHAAIVVIAVFIIVIVML